MIPYVYRCTIGPALEVALEKSGNVVLITPERTITVTDIVHLTEQLKIAREIRDSLEASR